MLYWHQLPRWYLKQQSIWLNNGMNVMNGISEINWRCVGWAARSRGQYNSGSPFSSLFFFNSFLWEWKELIEEKEELTGSAAGSVIWRNLIELVKSNWIQWSCRVELDELVEVDGVNWRVMGRRPLYRGPTHFNWFHQSSFPPLAHSLSWTKRQSQPLFDLWLLKEWLINEWNTKRADGWFACLLWRPTAHNQQFRN